MATKMFNVYSRMIAVEYLFKLFALPVGELNQMAANSGENENEFEDDRSLTGSSVSLMGPVMLEVDPSKMDEAQDDQVNTLQLWLIAQKLFSSLAKSTSTVPSEIRQILKHVFDETSKKFEEHDAYKAMGAFFFLRFVCPSLMAPQLYGLLKMPPHSIAQRQLVLLAKVLQNLANDTLPGKKEGYMAKLDEFITSNQDALRRFYDNIIAHSTEGPSVSPKVPEQANLNSLGVIHQQISTTYDKLGPVIQQEDEQLESKVAQVLESIGDVEYN